jgi:sugar phosphate isomerase/epimerase
VYVACSTSCFTRYPLDRALRLMAEMEFSKLEVVLDENGPHLRPSEVLADVSRAAQRIRIGPSLSPAAFALEVDDPAAAAELLRGACRLARSTLVSLVTVAAAPAGTPVDAEVKRLKGLLRLAEAEGVVLSLATRVGTLTETPDVAVELCQRLPGLGLTLDPSHFIAGPHQGAPFDAVYPYVRHVCLRDTGRGPGQFQVRVGQGEVEYGRIVTQLARFHYDRLLSVAIQDVADAAVPIEPEVRKLKFLLESLV